MEDTRHTGKQPAPVAESEITLLDEESERGRQAAKTQKRRERRTTANIGVVILLIVAAIVPAIIFLNNGCLNEDNSPSTPLQEAVLPTEATAPESTAVITAEPTEVPTEEPTPEPTATPIPEDWYIDPQGIIPTSVEILVPYMKTGFTLNTVWCITRSEDGKNVLQEWNRQNGLVRELEVPEQMNNAAYLHCETNMHLEGDIYVRGYLTEDMSGDFEYFLCDGSGHSFCFECTSSHTSEEIGLQLGTTDGKYVVYKWGDDYYRFHDFGNGASVFVSWGAVYVNEEFVPTDNLTFTKVNL